MHFQNKLVLVLSWLTQAIINALSPGLKSEAAIWHKTSPNKFPRKKI